MGYSIITGASENQFMDMAEQLKRFYNMDLSKRVDVLEMGIKYANNMRDHGGKNMV